MRPSLRFQVLQRDNFTCQYCGASGPEARLEVDHRIPRARGGTDALANLTTACWNCNHGKRDRLLAVDVPDVDIAEYRAGRAALRQLAEGYALHEFTELLNEWSLLTGRDWPLRRERLVLEELRVKFGWQSVSRAMRISAVLHGYGQDVYGEVDFADVEQLVHRWGAEERQHRRGTDGLGAD